jgi:hypothetical protein
MEATKIESREPVVCLALTQEEVDALYRVSGIVAGAVTGPRGLFSDRHGSLREVLKPFAQNPDRFRVEGRIELV